MKIVPYTIRVRDLVEGYRNDDEEGVVAFGGNLDVRPKYQREFIYSDDEQKAVIDTVTKSAYIRKLNDHIDTCRCYVKSVWCQEARSKMCPLHGDAGVKPA